MTRLENHEQATRELFSAQVDKCMLAKRTKSELDSKFMTKLVKWFNVKYKMIN